MSDQLEITLLGGVTVQGSPGPVPARALGLLAYLVVHAGTPQARSHLAGTFWPDSAEPQARTNLRRELHQLRALLRGCREDPVLVETSTLAWRDVAGCQVDVRVFSVECAAARAAADRGDVEAVWRHGNAAATAYRGPLLPGWYDDWALEAREALQQECVDLCDLVVTVLVAAGDPARPLALARRRVQLAPLEELGYRRLIELQAASGDRAGAMTTYHRCVSVLEQDLGVSPSPTTVRAMEAVLGAAEPRADLTANDVWDARRTVAQPSLIGRHDEVDLLLGYWQRVLAGQPGLALVAGEAGVGKSRLVEEFSLAVARQGGVVATARCFGSSGRIALAPVADWLRDPQLTAAEGALEPVWREEVARLLPRGSPATVSLDAAHAKVDAWHRLRFFEGLARAVLVVARPTLLVLDDLQWCDDDTMLWIAFLLGLARDAPLLVVATARDEELADNADVLASIRSLRSIGAVLDVRLGPFSAAETARAAAQMLGSALPDDEVTLLHSATGGFPLYVVEALRNVSLGEGAASLVVENVGGVLRRRLDNASESAREVAGLASAVGRDFGLELLSEASDLDADTVVRAVDELWRRHLLRQSGQGYDFAHGLLREVAYASVPPARRWLHHRRLAQALEILHANRLDDVAAQLAHHHACSGRPDRAMPFYARAAEAAAQVFATAEAIRLLRLSLDLVGQLPPGRGRDLQEMEVLQAMSAPLNALHGYASPELRTVLTRLVELAQQCGQTEVELGSTVGLWASCYVGGDVEVSHRLAHRALDLAELVPALAGQADLAMGGSSLARGDVETSVDHLTRCCTLSVGAVSLTVGTRPEVHAQAWSAHARWLLGDSAGAERDRLESVRRAREVDHPYSLAVALAYAAVTSQLSGGYAGLDETLTELTELCRRYDIAYYREWGLILSGWRAGGVHGIARVRTGLANLSAQHSFVRMPYWLSLLADAHQSQGDNGAARAALDAARIVAVQNDDLWWLPEVLRQSAALQPPSAARTSLQRAVALAEAHGSVALLQRCRQDLLRLGRSPEPSGVRPARSGVRGTA